MRDYRLRKINKKAVMPLKEIIFILINLAFFSLMFLGVWNKAAGYGVYEQSYSKKIALILDAAKPETTVYVNLEELYGFAQDNGADMKNIIQIDKENKIVRVVLRNGERHGYHYYSNANIDYSVEGGFQNYFLKLDVK